MSLWFDLHINNKNIGRVTVRRLDRTDLAVLHPDAVSRYAVKVDVGHGDELVGHIDHRYGNGPFTLARMALQAYEAWEMLREQRRNEKPAVPSTTGSEQEQGFVLPQEKEA